MPEPGKPETSRIAIKFGDSSSGSTKKPSWPAPSSALGKRSRARHGLGDDSSESGSEDGSHALGRHERITAFGENGAEVEQSARDGGSRARRGPLIIEMQANRDWRSEVRARRHRSQQQQPPRTEGSAAQKDTEPADSEKQIKWGLSIAEKGTPGESGNEEKEPSSNRAQEKLQDDEGGGKGNIGNGSADDNIDKAAMDALLGQTIDDRTKTRLVIEGAANTELSEDDVFRRDFHDAPDVSTLDEYEAMPVEEFGAALLRGMGWDGKDRGPKVKQVKKRPNQLGLGAKELKGDEELGAWNSLGISKQTKRPPKLHEYRQEQEKRRERREERYQDSYKAERDRDRHRDRGRDREPELGRDRDRDDRRYGHSSSGSSHHHHDRHQR